MTRRDRRKAATWGVAALVLALLGAAVARVVAHPSSANRPRAATPAAPSTPAPARLTTARPPRPTAPAAELSWPVFGYDAARLHVAPPTHVRPPFRVAWVVGGQALLEFPPVIAYRRLFVVSDGGRVLAVDARTGSVAWSRDAGRVAAASPAVGDYRHGTVYAAFLNRRGGPKRADDGEVIAFAAGWGQVRWRRRIGATETSPLLVGNRLYLGDWRGELYALRASTGATDWTYRTGGAVKGGLAYAAGRIFAGSYDGHVYCLDAGTGALVWRTRAAYGTLYSTPAVAGGRVFVGSTDGSVYAFDAAGGAPDWAYRTGGYVYGSPAVAGGRLYVGSYDHGFYALDARSGRLAWRFPADGPISGSATVVDGLVYFATLSGRTYALDAGTGRLAWSFPGGKYTPVVSDRTQLYLVGDSALYALRPRR